jgi:hypothetical protein
MIKYGVFTTSNPRARSMRVMAAVMRWLMENLRAKIMV